VEAFTKLVTTYAEVGSILVASKEEEI